MSRALLDKLLQHSYDNYQVLFNHLRFHNHNAHHLGSLHFLGISDEKLEEVYKLVCAASDPNAPSPYEITRDNWRDFLGNRDFCKAYKDFFEKEIFASGDDWRQKLLELLLEHKEAPLINSFICGLGHSLIHIGYALELGSNIVGIEGLALAAVNYDELHEIIDKLESPKIGTKSPLEVFRNLHNDDRLPKFHPFIIRTPVKVTEEFGDVLLDYYNLWKIQTDNLEKAVEELLDFSIYVYAATHDPEEVQFDFFIIHLLTIMHAVRVIQPYIGDALLMKKILMQIIYTFCLVYVSKNRPLVRTELIDDYKIDDEKHNWDYVIKRTLDPKIAAFRHVPKIIHSLRCAEKSYGSKNGFYLKAAVKTVDNLYGDDGFVGASDNAYFLISLKNS